MNKKILISAVVVVVVIIALFFVFSGEEGSPGDRGSLDISDLENLELPVVGEEAPEEGVGVPGKVTEGESGKAGQQYWVFETELKDGKLDPFEFRLPVGDLLGMAILNGEADSHTVSISGSSEFVPNFIERTISPGGSASMRAQVLEVGVYDILCSTCEEEVIGNFIVVPKN